MDGKGILKKTRSIVLCICYELNLIAKNNKSCAIRNEFISSPKNVKKKKKKSMKLLFSYHIPILEV